MEAFDNAQIKL